MTDEDRLKWICCAHTVTTEPDANGDAICFRCGLVIQIRFNMNRFVEALRKMR